MGFPVVRYSEQPELWEGINGLSSEVWPEYNLHGEVLGRYWGRLYESSRTSSSCCTTPWLIAATAGIGGACLVLGSPVSHHRAVRVRPVRSRRRCPGLDRVWIEAA